MQDQAENLTEMSQYDPTVSTEELLSTVREMLTDYLDDVEYLGEALDDAARENYDHLELIRNLAEDNQIPNPPLSRDGQIIGIPGIHQQLLGAALWMMNSSIASRSFYDEDKQKAPMYLGGALYSILQAMDMLQTHLSDNNS